MKIKTRLWRTIALFVCLSVGGVVAHAAPVNYQEQFAGDLPETGSPLPTFTLDVGQNVVAGTESVLVNSQDFDSFAFIIPAGDSMLGGGIVANDRSGDITDLEWQLYSGSANSNEGTAVGPFVESGSPGAVTLPALGPGTYNFSAVGIGGDGSADYIFTFDVVPEPVSAALLSVAGLALARRSRR